MPRFPSLSRLVRLASTWLAAPVRAVQFGRENPLARRVIAWMLLCSVGLAMASTMVQLWVTYRREVSQIEHRLAEIERSSTSALAFAAWNLDQVQLKAVLSDLVALPDIAYAGFVDTRGRTTAAAGTHAADPLSRVIPVAVTHLQQGGRVELGSLVVEATLGGVHENLRYDAILTLASTAGETFLVSFLMLLIFRSLVSRPLSELARSAARTDLVHLADPIALGRRPGSRSRDDFDTLVHALNTMRSSLKRDVDELRAAREALGHSEERYRSLVESTNVVAWAFDPAAGRLTFIGPRIAALLGHACDTWYEEGFSERNTEADGLARIRAALVQAATDRIDIECRLRAADGRLLWFSVQADRRGEPSGRIAWQGHLIDIDARKCSELELARYRDELEQRVAQRTADLDGKLSELEVQREEQRILIGKLEAARNQAIQSEKLASIGQLAAGVAHEINNPIGFVLSNFKSLERYMVDVFGVIAAYEATEPLLPRGQPAVVALERARDAAEIDFVKEDVRQLLVESCDGLDRVKQIVQDLKDFSHVGNTGWQAADLVRGIESTLNVVRNEIKYKADVVKRYGELPEIDCVPSQLNQVFMNLLVNAAQAISGRGTITISCGAAQDQVWVEVGDTGSGIAPEALNRIFDPFFTTKPVGQGTGLGLSLSYSIVRQHGGRIEVESTPGVGSTFRVWLPIHQAEEPQLAEYA